MVPYVDDLNVEKLHVKAPTEIIFLCGGPFSYNSQDAILSLRDAFLRVSAHPAIGDREVVLAENFTRLSVFSAHYEDILEFETDLAQITELIVLFCESVGSFTELGSFASIAEIADRLLVIIRDYHYHADSFIKLGPLRSLDRTVDKSVFVLEDQAIGIHGATVGAIDLDNFRKELDEPLRARLDVDKEPTTFDPNRAGHVIKLAVGLVQEYGALEFKELQELLPKFGVLIEDKRLRAFLLCAETVRWVRKEKKGFRELIIAEADTPAIHYVANENVATRNRTRRRLIIREYWEKHDAARFRAIAPVSDL